MRRPVLVLLGLLLACSAAGPLDPEGPAPQTDPPYVVLVSFDGMRYDMIGRAATPNFDRLADSGVRSTGLIPAYPSKTFPNHYTLATGLYPANHGIVDNTFYDPEFDAIYRISNASAVTAGRWYGGEPIWVTAETQGIRSASFFWVGSEAEIGGVRPREYKAYDGRVPYEARVDTVLEWLSRPVEERPRLVLLYFSEPDHTGHDEGPDDPAVDVVVQQLDGILGRLLDGIEALPTADQTHIVVVSDHGMEEVPPDQVVYLDDHVDLDGVFAIYNTTQSLLFFDGDDARLESVYDTLSRRLEHATVYRREETPDRWHYDHGRRIGDLIIAADPGWVLRMRGWSPWGGGGTHGWDPYYRNMQGVFMAAGPRIRPGMEIAAFENIHVYPFVAHLLDLEPAAGIDGRLEILEPALLPPAVTP